MNKALFLRRFAGAVFVAAVVCTSVVWLSTEAGSAPEEKTIGSLWSPSAIQEFRMDFIKNFKRIGLNTTHGDAAFLRITIQSARLKRGIEVGTATGFGAVNMGMGFERTGGHLYTLEIDPEMARKARDNIKQVGLEKTVTVVEGDALKTISQLEGKFDFVFLDALKQDYLKYFTACLPMLKQGAVIVADNVIKHARPMRNFLEAMEKDPDYDMVIIRCSEEKGDGMALIYKIK